MNGLQYALALLALTATAVIGSASVLSAWDSGAAGTQLWLTVPASVMATIGAPALMLTMERLHRARRHGMVFAAGAFWLMLGGVEVVGAHHWLVSRSAVEGSQTVKSAELHAMTVTQLQAEQEALRGVKKALLTERKENKIADLHRQEKTSEGKIATLTAKALEAHFEGVGNQWAGYEWVAVLAWWLCSQFLWLLAAIDMSEQVFSGCVRHGVRHGVLSVRQEPSDTGPDGGGGGGERTANPIERTQEEQCSANSEHPSVRPVLSIVPKDTFTEQVAAYSKAGFSVRKIAKMLGCGQTKVHTAISRMTSHSTESSA